MMHAPRRRRGKSPPLIFLVLLVFGLLLIGYVDQQRQEIRAADGAVVLVRDGDSLAIDGTEFRIFGIDAPELGQSCEDGNGRPWRCGEAAKSALRNLVSAGDLRCQPQARDRFGRTVATCRVKGDPGLGASGLGERDLGEAMVRQGMAIDFADRGGSSYAAAESAARRERRGIWQGRFTPPAEWRRNHPRGNGRLSILKES